MQLELVKDMQRFLALESDWGQLLSHAATNTIFQTHYWHRCWLESYAVRGTLHLLCAWEEGALVGVAPLFSYEDCVHGFHEKAICFIGGQNYASDYCDFIISPQRGDVLHFLISALFTEAHEWSYLELVNVPHNSPHYDALTKMLREYEHKLIELKYAEAPALVLQDPDDATRLLARKSIKRNTGYFQKHGSLKLNHCSSPEEINQALEVLFQQHIQRRAQRGDRSMFTNEIDRKFYQNMARELFAAGTLRLSMLLWNERPIACHLGFAYGSAFLYYKPTFDCSLYAKSPGQVMLTELLRDAVQQGFREFDFTVGEERYKYQFANQIRTNMKIWVYRRSAPYLLMKSRLAIGKLKRYFLLQLQTLWSPGTALSQKRDQNKQAVHDGKPATTDKKPNSRISEKISQL